MSSESREKLDDVSVVCKANVYFEGKVVSHTVIDKAGRKRTVGLIYPGSFTFNTEAPERMDVIAGTCRVRVAGTAEWTDYAAGSFFRVPGRSSFDIAVDSGIAEYLCTFE